MDLQLDPLIIHFFSKNNNNHVQNQHTHYRQSHFIPSPEYEYITETLKKKESVESITRLRSVSRQISN